jgi:hypothetical protein
MTRSSKSVNLGSHGRLPHGEQVLPGLDVGRTIRIAVIGSACTPPGYVQIECDVLPE